MLKLQEFILNNENWEEILSNKPYCIRILHKYGLIMFNYSQIDSDFNNDIVRECRGLILEEKTFKPVCVPFYKFGNYGESYADNIDWDSAKVSEKIDGSCMILYYYNGWNVKTIGTFDAYEAPVNYIIYNSFGELFKDCFNISCNDLNKNYTYMFELVSPITQVVIKYNKLKIYHIGTRDNNTLQELDVDIGIEKPKTFPLKTLNDCITFANEFNGHEGVVVLDKYYHRIKVKNPVYIAMHHTINNHNLTIERMLDIINTNELEEFTNYFPEYKEDFEKLQHIIYSIVNYTQNTIDKMPQHCYNNRKELAEYANSCKFPHVIFLYYDNKISNAKEWFCNQTIKQQAKNIKLWQRCIK